MTKAGALYQFFSAFGLPAFQEDSVPTGADKPDYPYVTYELATGSWGSGQIPLAASVWDRSTSLARVTQEAERIAQALVDGVALRYDGGGIRLWIGTPDIRYSGDSADDMVKRAMINIMTEYI